MIQATLRFTEKREAILDGAARQFNQHGIRGATLTEIASSVGLATNSLTYYYRKKEDLACACLLRSIAAIEQRAVQAKASASLPQRIRGFITAYVGMLADIAEGRHPEMVVFNEVRALKPPHAAQVFAAYTTMFRAVRALLRSDSPAPALSREAMNARAHLLLSLTLWARAWIFRYEPAYYALAGERMADVLLNGLAQRGQQWQEAPADPPPKAGFSAANDTREAFLRVATRLLNEHGYHGVSVERIAAELNLTKGSFYHHHETKDELISACFERTFSAMRELQGAAAASAGNGWQRLVRGCDALVRYQMSEQGPLLRVSAWSALPDEMRRDKLRTITRLGERFGSVIVDGMADGSIRVLDQAVAAQMVNGMINAAAELERWVPNVSAANAAALYARPLLEGLLEGLQEGQLVGRVEGLPAPLEAASPASKP